jgi:hypothetical protein
VAAKGNKKKIFIGPDESTYLPVLDIVHKTSLHQSYYGTNWRVLL